MAVIRRHLKLILLMLIELAFLIMMVAGSFGEPSRLDFVPEDFADNVRDRTNISVGAGGACFSYDPKLVVKNDEGVIVGDDLLTGKFALGSGAYLLSVDYEADASNGYVELYSINNLTETLSEKVYLSPGNDHTSAKIYVPFARSLHDIQMNIHYTGPGSLTVSGISLAEDVSYRWVPIMGFLLLFVLIDSLLWVLFASSGAAVRRYLREHYEIPVIAVVIFLASLPDMTDYLYVGHDMEFHLARLIAVAREISYGQFPVRMLTDMLKGYSYPTSTFYCDLFICPFSLLYLLGFPLRMCWQTYVLAVNMLASVISYLSFKRITGDRDAALTGTAVYVLSAYRIVDIYLRSAMGEFTAITFIPLVILGIWIIYYEEKESCQGWVYLGSGMSCIALCHLLSLEMISLFLVFFCLLEYRKTFTRYRLLSICKAAVMTVLLSCWFIFPMLLSMRSISLSMFRHQNYIQMHGAYPAQVFNPFMRGKGYSAFATSKEMPLSIGGGIIVSFAMLIYTIFRRDIIGERGRQRVAFVLTALSLVFSMYFFPWDTIASITEGRMASISRLFRMVQFPWRFLEITTVVLSVTAAVLLKGFKEKDDGGRFTGYNIWTGLLILGTVISLGAFYDPFINEADWGRAADESYIEDSIGLEEYLPDDSGRLIDLNYDVETGGETAAVVVSYEAEGGERFLSVSNPGTDASVLIPVFAYPGYRAEDEATKKPVSLEAGNNARIKLAIPAGYNGRIRIYYKEPICWRICEIISIVSLIFYIVLINKNRREEKNDTYQ
ncbi:MAG: hypothetical protein IJT24_03485 [Lachnospiraceae bacterium]|nr:hypothetical protein [Lachnospiraceae bacterium]